ncbi:MAG: hypothetical protein R3D68_05375 [Hyphomicrobiaceae bacterium]
MKTDATFAGRELTVFRAFFLIAALWNFIGGIPGVVDPEGMFTREFGRTIGDPVLVAVYRGAWGAALLYGFGFLVVALNPLRHSGVVAMGGMGKALFALNLAYMLANGWASGFAILVILGDIIFVAGFIVYFMRLRRYNVSSF